MRRLIARDDARDALASWLREFGSLSGAAAAHPEAETLRGRGRVHVVPSPVTAGERWVVRHYHRGGAVATVLGDRYLRLGPPRPEREYRVGRALERLGVPTPPHVGAAWYAAGPFRRGDLVTGYVPGSHDLAAVLFPGRSLEGEGSPAGPAAGGATAGTGTGDVELDAEGTGAPDPPVDRAAAMEAAGRLLRTLHEHGVSHPDLNLKNVLITEPARPGGMPRALVLDLDRARIRRRLGERARRRMIERFWRSARKWETRTGERVGPAIEAAFRAGYGR